MASSKQSSSVGARTQVVRGKRGSGGGHSTGGCARWMLGGRMPDYAWAKSGGRLWTQHVTEVSVSGSRPLHFAIGYLSTRCLLAWQWWYA